MVGLTHRPSPTACGLVLSSTHKRPPSRTPEHRCKAEVGDKVRLEFGDFVVDNRCWIRTGHTMTQVNQKIYIFGGVLTKDGSCSNELFWMTTERMEWHNQPTRGDKPCPR